MFNEFMDEIKTNSAESNKIVEGDYIKNGLYHCHICHTPKQYRLKVNGKEMIMGSMCKCLQDKEKAEKEAEKQRKLRERKRTALGDNEMLQWDFAHDDGTNPKITEAAKKYCNQFEYFKAMGKGIMLYGPVGTGKTFVAAEIVNELVEKKYRCYFTSITRLVNGMPKELAERNRYIDRLNDYDLLVLDDFSAEKKTEYMQEAVYLIVNARYVAGLPLIITTNLTADEIKNTNDITFQRTYSRISEMCHPILVDGADRRKEKARAEYKATKELLGI